MPSKNAPIVNDFNIKVATVNGTGSQSSNNILIRAIFKMGIPVSGKNIFPSNIQGLPTWFTIRVSKDGYIASRKDADVLVAMNPQTVKDDVAALSPGKAVIYNTTLAIDEKARPDLHYYPFPFDELVLEACDNAKLRKLVVNMVYVGAVAQLAGIEWAALETAVHGQFKGKGKAVELNLAATRKGMDYAKEHFGDNFPCRVEPMNLTQGRILIEANTAVALGCVFGGCSVFAWYPITPASSVGEMMGRYAEQYRSTKDGKTTLAVVQAEDELAAAGVVVGAGWAGARAATSTSGPGVSLMSEFAGLAYYAEVPCVIIDVQRVGPSTGLPTRTQQSDILQMSYLSHGDTEHIVLIPASPNECFTFTQEAFNLAEEFQTLVLVMTDLDLGMNYWMADSFPYPTKPFRRGKVLDAKKLDELKQFSRYKDVDGDGVTYRTLPGTEHPVAPFFTRGSGHDEDATYSESPAVYTRNLDRLKKKYRTAVDRVPQPDIVAEGKNDAAFVAFGSTHCAVLECLDQLRARGEEPGYLRLKALPLNEKVREFVEKYNRVYVVEQNRDGQMTQILRSNFPDFTDRFHSILHYNSLPIDAASITDTYLKKQKEVA
jgi:2-oxoglutarate ferredoxin oxidoreductase subunit alpha